MSPKQIMDLLEARIHPDLNILLDDGEFFIEHNGRLALAHGHGLLLKHCPVTPCTPEGVEILGGYDQQTDDSWSADMSDLSSLDSDTPSLGSFASRNEAIAALWCARHRAYVPANLVGESLVTRSVSKP